MYKNILSFSRLHDYCVSLATLLLPRSVWALLCCVWNRKSFPCETRIVDHLFIYSCFHTFTATTLTPYVQTCKSQTVLLRTHHFYRYLVRKIVPPLSLLHSAPPTWIRVENWTALSALPYLCINEELKPTGRLVLFAFTIVNFPYYTTNCKYSMEVFINKCFASNMKCIKIAC